MIQIKAAARLMTMAAYASPERQKELIEQFMRYNKVDHDTAKWYLENDSWVTADAEKSLEIDRAKKR